MARTQLMFGYAEILYKHQAEKWIKDGRRTNRFGPVIASENGKVRRICVRCTTAVLNPKQHHQNKLCSACWDKEPVQECRDCECKFKARRAQPVCLDCYQKAFNRTIPGQTCTCCKGPFSAKGYRRLCIPCWQTIQDKRKAVAWKARREG